MSATDTAGMIQAVVDPRWKVDAQFREHVAEILFALHAQITELKRSQRLQAHPFKSFSGARRKGADTNGTCRSTSGNCAGTGSATLPTGANLGQSAKSAATQQAPRRAAHRVEGGQSFKPANYHPCAVNDPPLACPNCGKEILKKRKRFCNASCGVAWRRTQAVLARAEELRTK